MITVYIASAYTLGDVGENVSKHLHVADMLISQGFCPIAPLLFHYLHIIHPRPFKQWLEIDFELLKKADVVLRIPGKSVGADKEEIFAKENKIPIMYSMEELVKWAIK